ncbi:MAG: transcription factor TFIIE [Desulfurococcaceae archaeon]
MKYDRLRSINGDYILEKNGNDELILISKMLVSKIYGETAERIFEYIASNEYIAEETISKEIGIKSNEGRKILQKLSEEAIVVPDKLRDGEIILHIWRLNKPALKTFVLNRLRRAKEKLEIRLKHELEDITYECGKCGRRYTFEEAYLNNFTCPYDNEILTETQREHVKKLLESAILGINLLIKKLDGYNIG